MCHADAMDRLPLNDPERDEVPLPAEVVFLLQTLDYSPITSEQIRIMRRRDPVLSKILDYSTGDSASMLMLNCQIRTRVDIMLTHKQNNFIVKQQNIITWEREVYLDLYTWGIL